VRDTDQSCGLLFRLRNAKVNCDTPMVSVRGGVSQLLAEDAHSLLERRDGGVCHQATELQDQGEVAMVDDCA
jgi:hypothetical protein